MQKLYLSKGEEVLVDDDDYPLLSRHEWQIGGSGYAATKMPSGTTGKCYTIFLHKLITAGFGFVDHINRNKLDCRKENLRVATWQENGWNKGKPKGCRHGVPTSQYKGVSYRPLRGRDRWVAMIKHVEPGAHKSTGKMIKLGYFWDEVEAAKAYNAKVRELRGEWAWVNPIPEISAKVG